LAKRECPQKISLTKAVADALSAFYTARMRHDGAVRTNRDPSRFAQAMDDAKAAERLAIAALEKHELEHGC